MKQVEQLRAGWEREAEAKKQAAEKRKAKKGQGAPDVEEDSGLFDDQLPANDNAPLFEDSDDDDDIANDENRSDGPGLAPADESGQTTNNDITESAPVEATQGTTEKELFGDSSSDESDEELISTGTKRTSESESAEASVAKKRRVMEEDDEE